MRCNSCGKDVPDDEVVFDTANVRVGPPSRHAYTQTAPVWLCRDCANNRRGNIRLIFWIVGVTLIIGAIIAAFNAFL